jgi:FKBP-type peptidyl-prolyl cis-trans isomerase 2
MKKAGTGDRIKVHYTGKLDDGCVFDSSKDGDPLEFVIGEGGLIKDFENAVKGMSVGESTTIHIAAADAYGVYRDDLLIEVPRERIPTEIEPGVGLALCMQRNDCSTLNVVISAVTDTTVTLDANHRLAGKDLTFDIEMVEIA